MYVVLNHIYWVLLGEGACNVQFLNGPLGLAKSLKCK